MKEETRIAPTVLSSAGIHHPSSPCTEFPNALVLHFEQQINPRHDSPQGRGQKQPAAADPNTQEVKHNKFQPTDSWQWTRSPPVKWRYKSMPNRFLFQLKQMSQASNMPHQNQNFGQGSFIYF